MEWKQLPYHEGQFYINNKGEVKNKLTGNILKGDVNNGGYYRVGMYHKSKSIRKFRHRLVAEHFLPNPYNYTQVNHINGDKSNNNVNNLEWVTQSQNEKHAFNTGLKKSRSTVVKLVYMDNKTVIFDSIAECSRCIGVSETTVHNWLYRGNKSHKQYSIKCLTTIP